MPHRSLSLLLAHFLISPPAPPPRARDLARIPPLSTLIPEMLGAAAAATTSTAASAPRSLAASRRGLPTLRRSAQPRPPPRPTSSARPVAFSTGDGGVMSGLLNSLKSVLGGGGGAGGPGGGDSAPTAASASAFADTAPSWADLAAAVAARREDLGVSEPDFDNVRCE